MSADRLTGPDPSGRRLAQHARATSPAESHAPGARGLPASSPAGMGTPGTSTSRCPAARQAAGSDAFRHAGEQPESGGESRTATPPVARGWATPTDPSEPHPSQHARAVSPAERLAPGVRGLPASGPAGMGVPGTSTSRLPGRQPGREAGPGVGGSGGPAGRLVGRWVPNARGRWVPAPPCGRGPPPGPYSAPVLSGDEFSASVLPWHP
jgi:hypothetical protein